MADTSSPGASRERGSLSRQRSGSNQRLASNVLGRNRVERQLSDAVIGNPDQIEAHEHFQFVNETDPRALFLYVIFAAIVNLISVVIIVVTRNAACDEPLREWLIAYTVGYILYVGTIVHKYYHFRDRVRDEQIINFLKLAFFAWWIVGQIWVYSTSPSECSPGLWGMCLALITLEYVRMCLPCIIICTVCCWYPCVARLVEQHKAVHGANKDQIEALTTRPFSGANSQEVSCSICLCDFEDGAQQRVLPCNHEYHVECIDEWLVKNRTCPLCRRDILAEDQPIGAGRAQQGLDAV